MTRRMERKVGRRFVRRGAWPLLAALACLPGARGVAAQVPDSVSRDTVSFRLRELRIEALRPVASVSGASAVRQLAVLVDGVPLTLGWDARTDLSLIPVDAAREIQLFRGISSVLHGPNVLGGVVSIEIGHGSVDADRRLNGMQGGMDATGAAFGGVRLGRTWSSGAAPTGRVTAYPFPAASYSRSRSTRTGV